MCKRLNVLFTLLLMCGMHLQAQEFETATQAVKNMGVGWNLGNTLDANSQTYHDFTKDNYWGQQGLESETCWGQSKAQPELIKMMKDAGFGAIRVPVTWYNHMDKDGKVNAEWMKRVHEVVDYVINQGLYCIVNVHHDTGADSDTFKSWIKADADNYTANKDRFVELWKQIAEEFKDYDEHLLFEGYNEMLDANSCWNYPTWYSDGKNYDANYAAKSLQTINNYAQTFVNTVRGTGGNNSKRNLVVNTYAACAGGSWGHIDEVIKQMKLPTETKKGHLIFEVHSYPNISNLNTAKSDFSNVVKSLKTNLVTLGAPVIFGEWGTSNVDNGKDYVERREDMIEFLEFFVKTCKQNDIATFYWMGLSDGAYRSLPAFNQPDLAECITKAYHGNDFAGIYPTEDDFNISYIVEYEKEWAELFLYGNYNSVSPLKLTEYKGLRIEMDDNYGSKLQVKVYGDATGSSFKEGYYTLSADSKTTTVNFENDKTGSTVSRITLQTNVGVTTAKINKVVLIKSNNSEVKLTPTIAWGCSLSTESSPVSGIHDIHYTPTADDRIYNLQGQQIAKPQRGIYIQNGKKFIAK